MHKDYSKFNEIYVIEINGKTLYKIILKRQIKKPERKFLPGLFDSLFLK